MRRPVGCPPPAEDRPASRRAPDRRIAEFARFDPGGIGFRYSQMRPATSGVPGPIPREAHVDLQRLREVMGPITGGWRHWRLPYGPVIGTHA